MKGLLKLLKDWGIEMILVFWFIALFISWDSVKKTLGVNQIVVLGGIYLITELVWDLSAVMALWYTGTLQSLWRHRGLIGTIKGLRKAFQNIVPNTKAIWIWFTINRIVAIIQPTTTALVAFFVLKVPFNVAWGAYIFMASDLFHTLLTIWRFNVRLNKKPYVREANVDDLNALVALDKAAFPDPQEQASPDNLLKRIQTSPKTCLVLVNAEGMIIGVIYGRPILSTEYLGQEKPPTWEEMANGGNFTPPDNPDAIYVVGIAGYPNSQASKFLEPAMAKVACLLSIKYIWAGSRITGYKSRSDIPVEEYIHLVRHDGWPVDPTLRSLIRSSSIGPIRLLRPVRAMTQSFPDPDSMNYAALVEGKNPFYRWPVRRFWGWLLEWAMSNL